MWISSLFNSDTTRLTPLDFRLAAAAQFRLLSAMCCISQQTINDNINGFIKQQFISARVLSPISLADEANALFEKFFATMKLFLTADITSKVIMTMFTQSRIYSAIPTEAFLIGIPESNQYERINTFYPARNNITFDNVSGVYKIEATFAKSACLLEHNRTVHCVSTIAFFKVSLEIVQSFLIKACL